MDVGRVLAAVRSLLSPDPIDGLCHQSVLIVSQIGAVVALIALGTARAAWVLYAAPIFDGITGGNIIVAQAYVTDVTPADKRAEALGLIFAVFGVSFFVGPALGGLSLGFVGQCVLGLLIGTFALFGEAVLFASWEAEYVGFGVGLILAVVDPSQIVTKGALLRPALHRFGELRLIEVGVMLRAGGMVLIAITSSPWLSTAGIACSPSVAVSPCRRLNQGRQRVRREICVPASWASINRWPRWAPSTLPRLEVSCLRSIRSFRSV